jgi:hypothetical protein
MQAKYKRKEAGNYKKLLESISKAKVFLFTFIKRISKRPMQGNPPKNICE